jgi:hypothetical protein
MRHHVRLVRILSRRNQGERLAKSRALESKAAAYYLARDIRSQGHDLRTIEGPSGEIIGKATIDGWIECHPGVGRGSSNSGSWSQ